MELPYAVLADCVHCRTEGAVLEVMDPKEPGCHLGVPVERRCRLCGFAEVLHAPPARPRHRLGDGRCPSCDAPLAAGSTWTCPTCGYAARLVKTKEPRDLSEKQAAVDALERWAREEGAPSAQAFCRTYMGLPLETVVARLRAGASVPTCLDVVAHLFSWGAASPAVEEPPSAPAPNPGDDTLRRPSTNPRAPQQMLGSLLMACGRPRWPEYRFVRDFLAENHLAPIAASDLRVRRPQEVGLVDRALRKPLVQAGVELCYLPGLADPAQTKVLVAYAHAWNIPRPLLNDWKQTYKARYSDLYLEIRRLLDHLLRPP